MTDTDQPDKVPNSKAKEPDLMNPDNRFFKAIVYVTFVWIMFGITAISGVRMYHNAPIQPAFIPLIGAAFAASLSFAIVLSLRYVSGEITIKIGENREFSGASGPIILWCICFLTIVFGLYFLGLSDAMTADAKAVKPCSVYKLMTGNCAAS